MASRGTVALWVAVAVVVVIAALAIVAETASVIADHIRQTIARVNNKPVYTMHEILEGKIVEPKML